MRQLWDTKAFCVRWENLGGGPETSEESAMHAGLSFLFPASDSQ